MKLTEMLEYTAEQYLDDRTALLDGDPDTLWSNEFLVRQFNEAERKLARRAWCIIEEGSATSATVYSAASAVNTIVLLTGVATYALHKSVLRVYCATPTDQEWPLYRTSDTALRTPRPYTDVPFDINNLSASSPGRPVAIATDASTRVARIFRTPSSTENHLILNLKIARLPVTALTMEDTDAEPEVPDDYHELLCRYAAGRALMLPNVDSQQRVIGRELLADFDAEVKEARQDRQRAEMERSQWGFASTTAVLDGGTR